MSLNTVNAFKAKKTIELCMRARLVPFIQGSPGIGKSYIVKQIADEYRLKMVDCRLSTMEPTDLTGLPWIHDGKAEFNPYNFFPLENTEIPKGYEGFLLFLDEFNSASKATQAAAYRLILDREVGQHKLHDKCFVVCAGNRLEDNAIVTEMSTAMVSRLVTINMDVDFEDWQTNFAIPNHIDERIVAYLSMYPNKLMQFDPEVNTTSFACPRTWYFAHKLIKAHGKVDKDLLYALSGVISFEEAMSFIQFTKVFEHLITIDALIKDPTLKAPKDTPTIWANVIHLIYRFDESTVTKVLPFIQQLPKTFQVVYARSTFKKFTGIIPQEYMDLVSSLGNFAFGDE